ncbi:hypothetical protein JXD38_10300 [candidate division WOR-3 bacterium]|nr:hypothetical protein [candidate division WOR-3 bacterium]
MSKLIALVVAGTALLLAAAGGPTESGESAAPGSAGEVVERYIEAVGGRDAVEQLSTRTVTGLLVHDLSWHDPQVETLRFKCRAGSRDRYVVEMTGSRGTTREGFDGVSGWRVDSAGVLHAEPDAGRSKFGWYLNPHHVLRIAEYFPNPTLDSIHAVNGRPCYAVRNDRPVPYYTLYIDTADFLLRAIGWHHSIEDYREVDGVMLPHRIVCGRKGGSSTYVFETIEHNLPMGDEVFATPQD